MSQTKDSLQRFMFEDKNIRGELVQLKQSFTEVLQTKHYPQCVQVLLGELLAASSLLTATLKFEGDITVQIQGDGPLSFAAVSGDHLQQLRGTARYEEELVEDLSFTELVGKAHIVITISPTKGERYQGIVAIDPRGLAQSLEAYFAQSEQLPTRIWLYTLLGKDSSHCGGQLLQVLPGESEQSSEQLEDLSQLANTLRAEELFGLSNQDALYRLYHQEEVQLYEPLDVSFKCTCSSQRCENALHSMDIKELLAVCSETGAVVMHCDFCSKEYRFNAEDIELLFNKTTTENNPQIH
ncbi:Hsp33 family molecular chaperone HslO [Alginatibacterium sediminis]|uniref:33 kDa chaperonin n=1 Tax=Alginatibacterium sediminis TaxID=2164068 RepID=A0A420E6E9_9ALTE|nr:Hsp33 family molecular chaperone HslO [Alginatibacterium sediminis]RKF13201.1 Hsp33 family molecular chaperone HslO [Alginatibacterium sediminis]